MAVDGDDALPRLRRRGELRRGAEKDELGNNKSNTDGNVGCLPILSTQAEAEVRRSARFPSGKPPMPRPQPRASLQELARPLMILVPCCASLARADEPEFRGRVGVGPVSYITLANKIF
jgi:hypothetical protein